MLHMLHDYEQFDQCGYQVARLSGCQVVRLSTECINVKAVKQRQQSF
jgi:hypothetical protein